jgi:hypothetical protein
MRRRTLGKKKIPVYGNWNYVTYTASGNWTVPVNAGLIDVCIVGPGANGGSGSFSSGSTRDYVYGGAGGAGGGVYTFENLPFAIGEIIPVTINGSISQFKNSDYISNAGSANNGGSGASATLMYSSNTHTAWATGGNGGDGKYLFGDSTIDGIKYGAGGAGGGGYYYTRQPSGERLVSGNPGVTGGGVAGNDYAVPGSNATTYGAGGGGGGIGGMSSAGGVGGSGKSGLVVIRYRLITGYQ